MTRENGLKKFPHALGGLYFSKLRQQDRESREKWFIFSIFWIMIKFSKVIMKQGHSSSRLLTLWLIQRR